MNLDFAAKVLGESVLIALRGEGLPRERLSDCLRSVDVLSEHDHLPTDLQKRIEAMMTACARVPDPTAGIRGVIYATTDQMDMWETWKWLEEIVSLYTEVIKREQREVIAREILAVRP